MGKISRLAVPAALVAVAVFASTCDSGEAETGVPDTIVPGTPRNLTSGASANDQNPLFTGSGTLVFNTKRTYGNFDIWRMDTDGRAVAALVAPASNDAVVTPGGGYCPSKDLIAYASDQGGSTENIWTIHPDGSGNTQLTNTSTPDWEPTWSPDCSRILFQSQRSGNWDIYSMKADGSDEQRLTTDPGNDWHPNQNPAGTAVLFQSDRTGVYKLWTVDASGGTPVQLTTGDSEETDCSWSPDGRYALFSTDRGGSGGARIGVLNTWTAGADIQVVTSGDTTYDGAPCWSPAGRQIAFESDRSGNLDIWIVDLE